MRQGQRVREWEVRRAGGRGAVAARLPLALAILGLAACAPENIVRVAPTAKVDSLVFFVHGISSPTAPPTLAYGLTVMRCVDERPFWVIAADGSRSMPETVTYGRPLPGFQTRAGPDTLRPGCYRVIVSRANPLTFHVDPGGQVRP
jgi:hypothetical protein